MGGQIYAPDVYHVYGFVSYFLGGVVGRIAVPLFFLISGYLFFRWTEGFSWEIYKGKISKRIRSLLVPFLLWNALYVAAFFALSFVTNDSAFDIYRHFDGMAILRQIWVDPPCFPFWFLRDLMVMSIFTIVTEPLLKYLKVIAPALLLVVWLGNLCPSIPGFSSQGITFFLLGAYGGIHRVDLPGKFRHPSMNMVVSLTLSYVLMGLVETWFRETEISYWLHNFNILLGILAVIELTAYSVCKGLADIPSAVTASSFFLYGYHGLFVKMLRNTLLPILKPVSDIGFLGIYAIDFIVTILVGVLLYHLAMKLIPKFTVLLCGGR